MKQKQNKLKVNRTADAYRRFCSFCKRLKRIKEDGKCESCGNWNQMTTDEFIKNASETKTKLDNLPRSFWMKIVIGASVVVLVVAFGLGVLVGRQMGLETCAENITESIKPILSLK